MGIYKVSNSSNKPVSLNITGSTLGFTHTKVVLIHQTGKGKTLQPFQKGGVNHLNIGKSNDLAGYNLIICTAIDFGLYEHDFTEKSWEINYQLSGGFWGEKLFIERCMHGGAFNYVEKRIQLDPIDKMDQLLSLKSADWQKEAEQFRINNPITQSKYFTNPSDQKFRSTI